ILGIQPIMASLGIAYIFKDPAREAECLTSIVYNRQQLWREEMLDSFRRNRLAQHFLKITEKLGRIPLPDEFNRFSKLVQRFGSAQRIARIANALLSQEDVASARRRKREELLLYMATMKLRGTAFPPFRFLPPAIQADMKMLWANYQLAQRDAEAFLF